MLAFFYKNFAKADKSTKRPSEQIEFDSKEVMLKNNTSDDAPVFIITGNVESDYNYILWNQNYYFIDDFVSINCKQMEVHCTKDYLATWKDYIGNYNAFVERSEVDYDPMIYDPYVSQNTNIYTANATTSSFSNILDPFDGFYILSTVSSNGVERYAMTRTTLHSVMASLFNPNSAMYGGLSQDVLPLFNPFQYVVGLKWYPLPLSVINTTINPPDNISFGWYNANIQALHLRDKAYYSDIKAVTLPTPTYSDFRQYSNQWTQYKIDIPSVGCVDIDSAAVKNGLRYEFAFDLISGAFTFILLDANRVIASYESQGAVDVQLGHYDTSNQLTQSIGVFSNILSFDPQGTFDAIHNSINPTPSIIGSAGTVSKWMIYQFLRVSYRTFETKDIPSFTYGRPCMQYKKIGNLQGFVKTMNAQVDFPCHGDERRKINDLMNEGFYYE